VKAVKKMYLVNMLDTQKCSKMPFQNVRHRKKIKKNKKKTLNTLPTLKK